MVCPKSWVDWLYTYLHPTVRSGWSHWVVMVAHHCYLWWSDTLWDSFGSHKVLWLHLWSCYHSQQLCKYLWSDLWQTFCLICHCPIGLVCGVWSLEMLSNLHLMVVISVQTILLWVLFKVFGVGGSANTSVFELHRGQENLIKKVTNSIYTNHTEMSLFDCPITQKKLKLCMLPNIQVFTSNIETYK
jgi:hypothetical protein